MLALLTLLLPNVSANEGMWLPEQLTALSSPLTALGFAPERFSDPQGALLGSIVSLGYCSASFVSDQGLVVTNHHCVSEYLQANSDAEQNLNRDGYLAQTLEDELWGGPAVRVYVVESIEDVTARVLKGAEGSEDLARAQTVARNRKAVVDACEKSGLTCEVVAFDGGARFRLIRQREYSDVRLVYAPPESVGSYGGEIDNWMWPRHAGDFALLRVWVDKDNKPTDYSPSNQPYRPPHHLKVSGAGVHDGDPVLAMGFPGSTSRYEPYEALRFEVMDLLPGQVALLSDVLSLLTEEAEADPEAAARLGSPIGYVANELKYLQGLNDNIRDFGVMDKKRAQWELLRSFASTQPGLSATLDELDRLNRQQQRSAAQAELVYGLLRSDLLWAAHTSWRLAEERRLPDREREEGLRKRDEPILMARMEALDQGLWLPAERRYVALMLRRLSALPQEQHLPSLDAWLAQMGGVDAAITRLFADPIWAQAERRRFLAQADYKRLSALDDPWLGLARALEEWLKPQRAQERVDEGALLRLRPQLMQGIAAAAGRPIYPDANSTLRVTFGRVMGYSPADGVWYSPQTTLRGVLAKAGDWPFDAPPRLLEAAQRPSRWTDPKLGSVPVDFLTDLDTTGGNSGSAVVNTQGQLVGLVFDGNYESMSADWVFDPDLTRSICVDARYLLWVLESAEGASRLVQELGF